jgi:integrase
MSVKVRPFRKQAGVWEVDITFRLPDGKRFRERVKSPASSKSGSSRWGQDREKHLLVHGADQPEKEVPTLEAFAPRFIREHAQANQQKPSGVASKESILRVRLVPHLGNLRLDEITTEAIQTLKSRLARSKPKTVNNALSVLSTVLKKAVEWNVVEEMPCSIKLLKTDKPKVGFHSFEEFERLVVSAENWEWRSLLIVLLGGEAGLRCGEMIALEWKDIDFSLGQISVQRSDWEGQVTSPKGGRSRVVPMTDRLCNALKAHRHLRSARVLCRSDGRPLTRQIVQTKVATPAKRAGVRKGVHVLRHTFCSHLAMRSAPPKAIQELAGHTDFVTTQRYLHLSPSVLNSAIALLNVPKSIGEMLETTGTDGGKSRG